LIINLLKSLSGPTSAQISFDGPCSYSLNLYSELLMHHLLVVIKAQVEVGIHTSPIVDPELVLLHLSHELKRHVLRTGSHSKLLLSGVLAREGCRCLLLDLKGIKRLHHKRHLRGLKG
jgi:hypothetical protein